ncbi:toll-like receptor 3 [Alosa pseudoharengus]|uniref:toll-like receptor 3 n=1 Tax=Alosa pseudoharengus TaxID=34774 RepID=UPI003F88FB77
MNLSFIRVLLVGCMSSFAPCLGLVPKRTTCLVQNGTADCSHLGLREIPSDLPRNITSLDVSHNQLRTLNPATLLLFPALRHLDVSYNSIAKMDASWCTSLPSLKNFSIQHNVVHILQNKDLHSCSNLTQLNLADNRLKLKDEPFAALQSLTWLDVSNNGLASVKLGNQPQMVNLVTLALSGNKIATLGKDDFYFLKNSSLQVLKLMKMADLQTIEPGCFKPLSSLRALLLDNSKLTPLVISKLCVELSVTALRDLSLRSTQQASLSNTTLTGLRSTNLTRLDLGMNSIAHIENGSFLGLSNLGSLSLEQNNLKNLNNRTFQGLENLRWLNLWYAVKGNVGNGSFEPLRKLEFLYMGKNSMKDVKELPFSGLHSLTFLDLSQSTSLMKTVTNRTFAALAGSPLKTLNLSYMAIQNLNPGAFSCLGNLTTLLLAKNFISQRLSGLEFQGLQQVEKIDLSINRQQISLTPESFINVPTLKVLYLGQAISGTLDLKPSPFQPLVNLTSLDLSNNNIANINEVLLEGLIHLKILKLQHNNLARLWKNANPGGPVLFLKTLLNLTILQMDSNGLDELPVDAFRGLTSLRELSLSGNILDKLYKPVFDDLISLRVLQMQKNTVTSVPKQVFQTAFANLSYLNMERNPFDCTCESILWFVEYLNSTNASVLGLQGDYICNTPPAYYNRSIMNFESQSCKDMTPFQALYILNSTAVLALLFSAFLVRFQGWRIQFYWSILVNRTLGFKDEAVEEGRYEYDGYIIHAAQDSGWVDYQLLPLEKENFKFFLEDRDAEPGRSQLEAIVNNMRKSRKIIFVVTEELLKDSWVRNFKAHHAVHQRIEDSRDSVVLVLLQEVRDHQLQALLLRRSMLKPRCVLHWPQQRERIPAFRQKLRLALASSNRASSSKWLH